MFIRVLIHWEWTYGKNSTIQYPPFREMFCALSNIGRGIRRSTARAADEATPARIVTIVLRVGKQARLLRRRVGVQRPCGSCVRQRTEPINGLEDNARRNQRVASGVCSPDIHGGDPTEQNNARNKGAR